MLSGALAHTHTHPPPPPAPHPLPHPSPGSRAGRGQPQHHAPRRPSTPPRREERRGGKAAADTRVPVPAWTTFCSPQPGAGREHPMREQPTTGVRGLPQKGTLNHPRSFYSATRGKRVLILPPHLTPRGQSHPATRNPPTESFLFLPCRDHAGMPEERYPRPGCPAAGDGIPGLLPSRSPGWASRWPEPTKCPHLGTAPAQPSRVTLWDASPPRWGPSRGLPAGAGQLPRWWANCFGGTGEAAPGSPGAEGGSLAGRRAPTTAKIPR